MIPAFFVFIFSVFLTNCCVIHGKLTDIVGFISFLVLFFLHRLLILAFFIVIFVVCLRLLGNIYLWIKNFLCKER